MKYTYFLFIILVIGFSGAVAQEDELPPPSPKNKKGEWRTVDEQPVGLSGDSLNRGEAGSGKDSLPSFQPFKKQKKLDWSKFILEPNFALSLGGGRFDVGLSPYVGYQVWEPKKAKSGSGQGLYLGGGVTYFYTGLQHYQGPFYLKYNFQTYGGGVFAQYNIWKGFFARIKVELLARRVPLGYDVRWGANGGYNITYDYQTFFTPAVLPGIGYNLLQSRNFFFPIVLSYNVLHPIVDKEFSLYPRGLVLQLGFVNVF